MCAARKLLFGGDQRCRNVTLVIVASIRKPTAEMLQIVFFTFATAKRIDTGKLGESAVAPI